MAIPKHLRRSALVAGAVLILLFSLVATQWASETGPTREPYTVYRVTLDDVLVGYAESADLADEVLGVIKDEEQERRGFEVALDGDLSVREMETTRDLTMMDAAAMRQRLLELVDFQIRAVAILVDGDPVAYLENEQAAREAIQLYITRHEEQLQSGQYGQQPGGTRHDESVEIESVLPIEEITYEQVAVGAGKLRQPEAVVEFLARGTDTLVTHTVQSGESMWTIAERNEMTVEELQEANPQLENPERLQPGDELQMTVPEPIITLLTIEIREYIRPMSYSTSYREDPNRWPWEERVIQAGEEGQRRVVERVERVGGEIISLETLEEEVKQEPTEQIVARGAKSAIYMGTGSFIWPTESGRITTRFGFIPSRGRTHNGIDIAAPTGTRVFAADSGVVSYAGWRGGYGKTVIIDHGGGSRKTLYAHLSAIYVRRGQAVDQGHHIGAVGSTGYSTGPHLHFEIHENGRPVDPMRFFD